MRSRRGGRERRRDTHREGERHTQRRRERHTEKALVLAFLRKVLGKLW